MKSKKRPLAKPSAPPPPAAASAYRVYAYSIGFAALIAVWWAYSPAFHGPFIFDDTVLPFARADRQNLTLSWYIHELRPMVMFSYWWNYTLSGTDPYSYHFLSFLLHLVTSSMVFLIVRRMLQWANAPESRRGMLAGFAAAVYLLHPVQTEAVAYIAGRFEALSVMFAYCALAIFVCRPRPAVSWLRTAVIFLLFGLALLSKEHTIALPALFLLTDYWWNPGFSFKGIRANWRLYVPMALAASAGLAFFWKIIILSPSAGFNLKDLRWYEYLFTQFRAIFVYFEMFVAPLRLTVDWDFPFSRTIVDRGSILGLIALVSLIAAAWILRRRFPLATYGFFMFLLLMAPTSSILPIRDAVAERRIYFSMPGLLLIVVDLLSRVKIERRVLAGACAAVAILACIGTHARAAIWSSPVALWEDTAAKSPNKPRVHLQLAQAYYDEGRYDLAVGQYEQAARLQGPDYNMLVNWGLAYQALNRLDDALAKFQQAAMLERTGHIYSQIGMIYVQRRQRKEALDALATAEALDPGFAPIFNYRGKLYFQANELAQAITQYRRALQLNPNLADARDELFRAQVMLRNAGGGAR